jgi:putative NIF3 family GTP cyclohydrolase 1 type 2
MTHTPLDRHAEYRQSLLDHLLSVTATHWDSAMRELGARTVASIAALQFEELAPQIAKVMVRRCLLASPAHPKLTLDGSRRSAKLATRRLCMARCLSWRSLLASVRVLRVRQRRGFS